MTASNTAATSLKVPHHPRVYCASPMTRSRMWRDRSILGPKIRVISTWHDLEDVITSDQDPNFAYGEWICNRTLIRQRVCDHLLVYAEHNDKPNGTLVEIGMALAQNIPVNLVGNFEWGSWRTLCHEHKTLREAVAFMTEDEAYDQA